MKRRTVCIGLLLCGGCGAGAVSPSHSSSSYAVSARSLSAYSDEELQMRVMEKYFEYGRAAASGDGAGARRAAEELIDAQEEALSRPSLAGHLTETEVRAFRKYFEFLRKCLDGNCPEDGDLGRWLGDLVPEGGDSDVLP